MLRCVQTASPEIISGGDMSVLERQRSMLQRLFHEQQMQLQNLQRISSFSPSPSPSPSSSQTTAMPLPLFQCQSFMNSLPIHPSIDDSSQNFGFGCSDIAAAGHSSRSRKRKSGEEADQFAGKNTEGGETGESESGITVKSEKENSGRNSGENSKEVVQKTEYIHVRARRGQATDSHSLAERARREKISKKMKCLQDLVPGCNKVTGKAGMLDEIINYVQSLQKQVEFLSMKLASLNPRLEFNMDGFFPKEIPAYVGGGFPASMEMAQSGMFPYNVQESSSSGLDLGAKTAAFPEAYLDSLSTLSQIQQMSAGLDNDWPSLFSAGFHQG